MTEDKPLNKTFGDFIVSTRSFEDAREENRERNIEERAADSGKRAPITTSFAKWRANKDELDFPGVDTPTDEPKLLPKDLKTDRKPRTLVGEPDEHAGPVANQIPDSIDDPRLDPLAENEDELF